jgi:hypothetical protein
LKRYWSTPFYSNTTVCDRFVHILSFLHVENNHSRHDPQYDRLWKIRIISDTLNIAFYELCNPTEHLAIGEAMFSSKEGKYFGNTFLRKIILVV